ncbi:MAG: inositol monophosphatase [Candidatus Omnitrophica bacterium]|nr:inositol monophosphatase [Candidatus Omnitrophota bacterium]
MDDLKLAQNAARQAGDILKKYQKDFLSVNQDLLHDVKIQADVESEKILIEYLSGYTSYSILSEERGLIPRDQSRRQWIIDPVDGSLNYSRGLPINCVSIGLWEGEEPLLGAVYDFNRDEMFYGSSKEAFLNDQKIKVSDIRQKTQAILATGFPANLNFSDDVLRDFLKEIQVYKKLRWLGSAALSICYVAAGRVDAYQENNTMWWDIAGAVPIVLGAGAQMNLKKLGQPFAFDLKVANSFLLNA